MPKKIYNAYYSSKCDKIYGHCLYKNLNGEILKVCAIYEVGGPQTFIWSDAVLVGQVEEGSLVRGNQSKTEHYFQAGTRSFNQIGRI
jgi:hypothetical protein